MESLEASDPRSVGGYPLLARLGAGGMGQVYLARTVAGRPLALKTVRAEFGTDPAFGERFAREIRNADRVRSPWTATVVDYSPAGASPQWLATEYVAAPSLADWVRAHGPLPGGSAAALGAELCEALHAVHRAGLAHRDVKPSNVLLAGTRPLLIDFGIARAADDTRHTSTGAMIGSPGYMAPEQAASGSSAEPGDVFALGAVLVYAATGRGPFNHPGETASTPALLYRVVHEDPDLSGVPEVLLPAVAALLVKDPADRPTALEAAALLGDGAGKAAAAPAPWSGNLPPGLAGELVAREEATRAALADAPAPPAPTGAASAPAAPTAPGVPPVAATTPYGPESATFRHPAYQTPRTGPQQTVQRPSVPPPGYASPGARNGPPGPGTGLPPGSGGGGSRRGALVAAAAVAVVLVVVGSLAVHRWRQNADDQGSDAKAPTASASSTATGTGSAAGPTGTAGSHTGSDDSDDPDGDSDSDGSDGSDSDGSGSADKLPAAWIGTWYGVGPGLPSVTGKAKVTITLTGGTRGNVVGKEVTHVTGSISGADIGCTDTLGFTERDGSTVVLQAVSSTASDPSSGTECTVGRVYTLTLDSDEETLKLSDYSGLTVGAPTTFTKQD